MDFGSSSEAFGRMSQAAPAVRRVGSLTQQHASRSRSSRQLAGAVEHVDGGPEQVFEVGLQARVGQGGDKGVEDIGQRGANGVLLGQRPRVGFVLEGTMAIKLEFGEEGCSRGFGVVRLVLGEGGVGYRGRLPAEAAPIAAFAGVEYRGRTGLAPPRACASGRSAAEDGVGRLFCFAMQSRAGGGGKQLASAVAGPDRFRSDRPLRRAVGAVPPAGLAWLGDIATHDARR